jgi:hypothetical protein
MNPDAPVSNTRMRGSPADDYLEGRLAPCARSGSTTSVISGFVLLACGQLERNAPAGPLNGPSLSSTGLFLVYSAFALGLALQKGSTRQNSSRDA